MIDNCKNDVMESATWTPDVEIRGCTVRHSPTRGFLCTRQLNPKALKHNEWLHTSDCAEVLTKDNVYHH